MESIFPHLFIYILVSILLGLSVVYLGFMSIGVIGGLAILFFTVRVLPYVVSRLSKLWLNMCWLHYYWILLFLSGLVFRIRDTEVASEAPLDIWAAYRIGLVSFVGLLLLFRLVTRSSDWISSLAQGLIGILAVYTFLGIASTFWSSYPAWTMYKSTEYLVDLSAIAAIASVLKSSEEWKVLFDLTWIFLGGLLFSVIVSVVVWPTEAIIRGVGLLDFQISGVVPIVAPNGVGEFSALLVTVAFIRFLVGTKEKRVYFVIGSFSFVVLLFSQTRSALLGCIIAIACVLFLVGRIGPIALLAGLGCGALLVGPAGDLILKFLVRGQNPHLVASLSGRTEWWEFGWKLFLKQPLTGYGSYVGSRFEALAEAGRTTTSSIHNTWLEILLGTGVPGFLLFSICFIGILKTLLMFYKRLPKQSLSSALALEAIGVLAVLSIRSLFSSGLIWHPSLPFLLVLGFAEYLRRKEVGRYQ